MESERETDAPGDEPMSPTAAMAEGTDEPADDPAIRAVLADPEVQAVLESADRGRLEKLLRRRRKFEPDPRLRQAIDALLGHRRLFVRPIRNAPSMVTFNGIGTRLYGRRDYDLSDGTYTATLWFVVLFIPLIPIRQYLVCDTGGGSFQFFGKVSMTGVPRLIQLIFLAALPVAAAAGIYSVWDSSTHADVHFLNGLSIPVRVAAGEQAFEVGVNERRRVRLPVGPCRVRVTDATGRLLEEQEVTIRGGQDLVAYNILGAAPLIVSEVIYTGKLAGRQADREPSFRPYVGSRLVASDNVDYAFTDPPSEIRITSEHSVVTRRHALVLDGGWQTSLSLFSNDANVSGSADLLASVVRADPTQLVAAQLAIGFAGAAHGQERAVELAEELLSLAPDSVELHRIRQEAMMSAGQTEQARELYRRMQSDRPDSPMACYLRARVEPLAESLGLYRELARRFPDYFYAVHGCAYQLHLSRQFAEAAPLFEKALDIRPGDAIFAWGEYLSSLIGAGRTDEAIARLVELCRSQPDAVGLDTAVLYGRLARRVPEATLPHPPDHYLLKSGAPAEEINAARAWFDACVDGQVDARRRVAVADPDTRSAIALTVAAGQDPDRALAAAEQASADAVNMIDDATLVVLACEAARLGREELARKLLDGVSSRRPEEDQAMTGFVLEGTESDQLAELPLSIQAALHLGRARRAQGSGQPADRHLADARADDLLGTVVTRAVENWAAARPGPPPTP